MVQPIDIDDLTRAILDSSTEFGIILSDQRGRVVFWNEGARRMTGWTAAEMIGNSADRMFTPEDIAVAVPEREMDSALAGGRSPDERWHVRKDGSRFWGSGMMHPLRQGGELRGFVKIVRDLTERRTAEERQTLLTRELQHRINNVLSLVQAIAAQTLRADVPVESARRAFSSRLQALSQAHQVLTDVNWAEVPVSDIVRRALRPHMPAQPGRVVLHGDENVLFPPQTALSVLLILHELATNAVKYGALGTSTGQVAIEWRIEPDLADRSLAMTWSETGGPPVAEPSRTGFGSRLIEIVLQNQGGSAQLMFRKEGVSCHIRTPLGELGG
jgi:PAS domain S-box-containing protein